MDLAGAHTKRRCAFLPTWLTKSASVAYNRASAKTKSDYKAITEYLKVALRGDRALERAEEALFNIQQLPGETVAKYRGRAESILRDLSRFGSTLSKDQHYKESQED